MSGLRPAPQLESSHARAFLCAMFFALLPIDFAQAGERPALINSRISSPFGANGHTSSLDGRLFVGNVYEDANTMTTRWLVRIFRPEALSYSSQGTPNLGSSFSSGKVLEVYNGENALAMCFSDPAAPYRLEGSQAVYEPWVFDSQMFGAGSDIYKFRRRKLTVRVNNPFTASAEVASVSASGLEIITTSGGANVLGIEPTMTADGRLFLYQGSPNNDGGIDHLMYTYNANPCSTDGWSAPRPLHAMVSDSNPDLKRYPIAWQPLRAATGESFNDQNPLHAAYPWVDHEGRFVLYMSVLYSDGARREAASLIGADTLWTAYHMDGAINDGRYTRARLFYSGPMWQFERERPAEQNLPPGSSNQNHYLSVTKNHDVLPLFGSNTGDYNEVDVADLIDPYHLLFLPMNELVTRAGAYDLTQSPDLSGLFQTGKLVGTAQISTTNGVTGSASGSLEEPFAKGRALQLSGAGGLRVTLAKGAMGGIQGLPGLSLQLYVRPSATLNDGCGADTSRYLLYKQGDLELIYEANHTVRLKIKVGRQWVDLGSSPVLKRDAWTHVAYSWDGVGGTFHEYLNGISTGRSLPTLTGRFRPLNGDLFVGSSSTLNPSSCPVGGSFQGAIDEVRLFSHARSNRSVCLTTYGTLCQDEAIQEDPSGGELVLSLQHPGCTSSDALNSLACASAIHRLCAQRGAIDALDSASNLYDTVQQLIGDRPPISLSGVPVSASSSQATIACAPIAHESMAVTWSELAQRHEGCRDERDASGTACLAASHRWCSGLGWSTGQIFESTTRAWVGCFDSDLIQDVARASLGAGCDSGDYSSSSCRMSVTQWCQGQGYGGGLVQEVPSSSAANVHCFHPAFIGSWRFSP